MAFLQDRFDVVDDGGVLFEGVDVEGLELVVCHGEDDGIILAVRALAVDGDTVLTLCDSWVGPRIVDGDVGIVVGQGMIDIYHLGIAYVGAVFLKGKAEDEDFGIKYLDSLL